MSHPRVAVLLPVYNRAWCVADTLNSLRSQTFPGFVVIAVDDASTDRSYALLKQAAVDDPQRWCVFRNERNLGMTANWNACLRLQRELFPNVDYIVKVDSDDALDPAVLATGQDVLDADQEAVICHFRTRLVTPQGIRDETDCPLTRKLAQLGWPRGASHRMDSPTALRLLIRYDNFIASTGTLIRRTALEALRHPWWDEAFCWAADYEMWTRLLTRGAIRYVGQVSVWYRQSHEGITARVPVQVRRQEVCRIAVRAFWRSYKHMGAWAAARLLPVVALRAWYAWALMPFMSKRPRRAAGAPV